jgi:hypothetical protein
MDNKNKNKLNELSPDELFKLLDSEKDHASVVEDDFDREALEGLKLVQDRNKILKLDSKIDEILEEESRRKAAAVPSPKGIYYFAAAASIALIIGFIFIFKPFTGKQKELAQDSKDNTIENTELSAPPPVSDADANENAPKKNNAPAFTPPAEKSVAIESGKDNTEDIRRDDADYRKGSGELKEETFSEVVSPVAVEEPNVSNLKTPELAAGEVNSQDKFVDEIAVSDASKRKEADDEKQTFTYYKDLTGGLIKSETADTSIADNLARNNNALNTNSGYGMYNVSPAVPGTGTTVNTSSPNNFSQNTVTLAKVTKEEEAKKQSFAKSKAKKAAEKNTRTRATTNEPATTTNEIADIVKNDEATQNKQVVADSETKPKEQDSKNLEDKKSEREVLTVAEKMPEYPGGTPALMAYLSKNLITKSETAYANKIYISFVVNANGKVEDVKLIKGLEDCTSCKNELIKAYEQMPLWTPGEQNGKKVNVRMTSPLYIKIK